MMKTIINAFILAVLIIISFVSGYYIASHKIKPYERIIIHNDTTTIIKEGKLKYIKDTILVIKNDTIVIKDSIQYAEMDTLTNDSLYLNVKYYLPPINSFMIKYKLPSREMIINHMIQDKRNINFGIGAGIFAGTKGIDFGILVGIYYQF